MTTIAKGFEELAHRLEELDLQPKIERGDVFWVKNSVLGFGDGSEDHFHPAVVMRVNEQRVLVRVMTSKVKQHRRRGVLVDSYTQVRLRGRSLILIGDFALRWVSLKEFAYSRYLYTFGPAILTEVDRVVASANGQKESHSAGATGTSPSRDDHGSDTYTSTSGDSLERVLYIIFTRLDEAVLRVGSTLKDGDLSYEIAAD